MFHLVVQQNALLFSCTNLLGPPLHIKETHVNCYTRTSGICCRKTHEIRIPCNLRSMLACHSQLVRNCFPMRIRTDKSCFLYLFFLLLLFCLLVLLATAAFYQFTQCCNIIDFIMSILRAKLNLCIFIVTGSANIKCPISFTWNHFFFLLSSFHFNVAWKGSMLLEFCSAIFIYRFSLCVSCSNYIWSGKYEP